MNEPIDVDIETVSAEALRKIGRNVVNFSKIEAALKYLLSISKFEGTEESISEQFNRNHNGHHKTTLGKLVGELHKNVLVDSSQVETTTDPPDFKFSISSKITCDDPDFLKSRKRALSDMVTERNKLIHQDLALFNTNSIEDYHKLISLLDEQNLRLLAHLEELGQILEMIVDTVKITAELWQSPEFLQYIQSEQIDA